MGDIVYYKRNVGYSVAVRRSPLDSIGVVLNKVTSWIAINSDDLRDFKIANKQAIIEGLIVPTDMPDVDWETPNALTDEDIDALLKSGYLKLKNALETIDSVSILSKILEAAKTSDKPEKTRNIIRRRLEEIAGTEILSPSDMAGSTP